jgi:hypothetical protein
MLLIEECLIDFREFIGQHSGENMAAAVWKTVEDFKLKGRVSVASSPHFPSSSQPFQITAFVMDNATNNDTMIEAFEKRCRAEGIYFSEMDGRMRCMPHTIHLSALKVSSLRCTGESH